MSGKLEEVQSPTNPGEFDSKAYYGCQRIYYVMKKGKIKKQSQSHSAYGQFLIDMQQKFAGILEKTCGMEAGAFEAIVLGDKTNLDPELKMRYQMAGIIHILAISGLHISLLGMGLYNLLKKNRSGYLAGRPAGAGDHASVWDDDRRDCFNYAGSMYVFTFCRCKDRRTDL